MSFYCHQYHRFEFNSVCDSITLTVVCNILNINHNFIFLLSGIYNPYEFEPPHSWGYMITHNDTPQLVELLWMSDQPVAETSTWQNTQHTQQINIYAPAGFELAIPVGDRPQTHALDRSVTGIGHFFH